MASSEAKTHKSFRLVTMRTLSRIAYYLDIYPRHMFKIKTKTQNFLHRNRSCLYVNLQRMTHSVGPDLQSCNDYYSADR